MSLAALMLLCSVPSADEPAKYFNADGYRSERYRAPLPATVPGGRTVNALELKQLIDTGTVKLLDVQAITLRPETAEFDMGWLPSSVRYHLPGSVWLPNVGYGELDAKMQRFFVRELARLSEGNLRQAIVFYCVADCWMSWNAVQRAARLGYQNLYWFPEGTDGWEAEGFALHEAMPQPLER